MEQIIEQLRNKLKKVFPNKEIYVKDNSEDKTVDFGVVEKHTPKTKRLSIWWISYKQIKENTDLSTLMDERIKKLESIVDFEN